LEGKYSDIMFVSVPQWELESGEIEEATHWLLENGSNNSKIWMLPKHTGAI
jgi:hypothetical protein